MSNINKNKVASSIMYKFTEQGLSQGIRFIITVILARLLSPEEFGVIALTSIFIVVARRVIDSGLNSALIQKKDADEKDFHTVFTLSLGIAIIAYIIIVICAPYIAIFFDEPQLKNILRILPIVLFTGSARQIYSTFVIKKMQFRMMLFSSVIALSISGAIGIAMAYLGYGIWSLVAQNIINSFLYPLVLAIQTKWYPKPYFSLKRAKPLFNYGSKILVSSFLDIIFKEVRGLIIGRMYTSDMLGYYNRGRKLPYQIASAADGSLRSVMFATLSHFQDDKGRMKQILSKLNQVTSYVLIPIMLGMALVAEPMVSVILTDKWLPAVPYIRIFCLGYAIDPFVTNNLLLIQATGRSDIILKITIIQRVLETILIIISIQYGIIYLALTVPLSSMILLIVSLYSSKKLAGYKFFDFFKDTAAALVLSAIMGGVVFALSYIDIHVTLKFILQVGAGILIYIAMSVILKVNSYHYIINYMKQIIKRKKRG